MTLLCGVDPGLSGAIAFLDTATGQVETLDMPTLALSRGGKAKRAVDPHALADVFWKRHAGHAYIEDVWSRPGQGTTSTGNFLLSYGVALGVLAAVGVPYTAVAPNKWKRALGIGKGKDTSRARASQLMPQAAEQWRRVKDDGRAEAALICWYGARELAAIARQLPECEDSPAVASALLADVETV